jgi:methionyl-tRNA synthetase
MITASRESLEQAEGTDLPALTLDALVESEFQTMRVVAVESVQESDRLVAFTVESRGERRSVVAGLGHDAAKSEWVGKDLLVLSNLEPKALRGRESQGMIIAAQVGDVPVPVVVPGSQTGASVE